MTSMRAYLRLDHIDKTYHRGAGATEVLKDISLTINHGEFVSIIGGRGGGRRAGAGGAAAAVTRAHHPVAVVDLHQKLGDTVVMIPHDVDEAVLLSDRIVMM